MRVKMLVGKVLCMGVLWLGFAAAAAHAADAWRIESTNNGIPMTVTVHKQWGAVMRRGGMPGYMISRPDSKQMIQVRHDGTHLVMPWPDKAQREAMQRRIPPAVLEQLQKTMPSPEALAQMSPQQRRQYVEQQRMLGLTPPPAKVEYKEQGTTQTINGFRARKVIKYEDGEPVDELWVAAVKDWQHIAEAFERAFPQDLENEKIPFKQLRGIPVKTNSITITSIVPTSAVQHDFRPPPGSKEISPAQMYQPQQR
jgi:hypothetical protein